MVVFSKDRIPCGTCNDGSLHLPGPSPVHYSARQQPHLQSRVPAVALSAQSAGVRMKLDRNGSTLVKGRLSGELIYYKAARPNGKLLHCQGYP